MLPWYLTHPCHIRTASDDREGSDALLFRLMLPPWANSSPIFNGVVFGELPCLVSLSHASLFTSYIQLSVQEGNIKRERKKN